MAEQFSPEVEADRIDQLGAKGYRANENTAEQLRGELCKLSPAQLNDAIEYWSKNYADTEVERAEDGSVKGISFYGGHSKFEIYLAETDQEGNYQRCYGEQKAQPGTEVNRAAMSSDEAAERSGHLMTVREDRP
jgi:hypothetical protein